MLGRSSITVSSSTSLPSAVFLRQDQEKGLKTKHFNSSIYAMSSPGIFQPQHLILYHVQYHNTQSTTCTTIIPTSTSTSHITKTHKETSSLITRNATPTGPRSCLECRRLRHLNLDLLSQWGTSLHQLKLSAIICRATHTSRRKSALNASRTQPELCGTLLLR